MVADTRRGRSTLFNVAFFAGLLGLCAVFFAMVRNNPFWHSGDFLLLDQAIDTGNSWRELFRSADYQPFQPLVKLVFYWEYDLFGLDPKKYYAFNIFVHSINAFLVYQLVMTLIRDRTIAVLSGVLFACAVGNYGKAVMVVSGISDLIITLLTLLTLFLYMRNETHNRGQWGIMFFAAIACLLLSLMTKATSFSILGCLLAFHFFFRNEIGKPVLNRNFLSISLVALIAFSFKVTVFRGFAPDLSVGFAFFRNWGSYLVRMVFPIHSSDLVAHAGPLVKFVYNLATEIRLVTFLCIISYTVFGFIFGNRTIRFFIAWTYITLLPFCFFDFPNDWLNIRYLYLVSVGFVMIIASATVFASRLLYQKRWRRFIPYTLPLAFVLLSQFIITHLDRNYELTGDSVPVKALYANLEEKYKENRLPQSR